MTAQPGASLGLAFRKPPCKPAGKRARLDRFRVAPDDAYVDNFWPTALMAFATASCSPAAAGGHERTRRARCVDVRPPSVWQSFPVLAGPALIGSARLGQELLLDGVD